MDGIQRLLRFCGGQVVLNAIFDLFELTNMRREVVDCGKVDLDRGATHWQSGHTAVVIEACELAIAGDPSGVDFILNNAAATDLQGWRDINADGVLGKIGLNILELVGMPKEDRQFIEQNLTPQMIAAAEERRARLERLEDRVND